MIIKLKRFDQFVNESWDPYDSYEHGTSNCCGSKIMTGGICADCGEHCESEEEDDYDQMEDQFDDQMEDQFDDQIEDQFDDQMEDSPKRYNDPRPRHLSQDLDDEPMYERRKAKVEDDIEDESPKKKKASAGKPLFGKKPKVEDDFEDEAAKKKKAPAKKKPMMDDFEDEAPKKKSKPVSMPPIAKGGMRKDPKASYPERKPMKFEFPKKKIGNPFINK